MFGRVWWWHAYFIAAWPLFAIVLGLGSPGPSLALLGGVTLIAVAGAAIGYFDDYRTIAEGEVGWTPRWWAWLIAHFIVSPFVVAPLYLARRWQQAGLRREV